MEDARLTLSNEELLKAVRILEEKVAQKENCISEFIKVDNENRQRIQDLEYELEKLNKEKFRWDRLEIEEEKMRIKEEYYQKTIAFYETLIRLLAGRS